jgi:hypothetical protein
MKLKKNNGKKKLSQPVNPMTGYKIEITPQKEK